MIISLSTISNAPGTGAFIILLSNTSRTVSTVIAMIPAKLMQAMILAILSDTGFKFSIIMDPLYP